MREKDKEIEMVEDKVEQQTKKEVGTEEVGKTDE